MRAWSISFLCIAALPLALLLNFNLSIDAAAVDDADSISIMSPHPFSFIGSDSMFLLELNVGTITGCTVTSRLDGNVVLQNVAVDADTPMPVSFQFTGLTAGSHTVAVECGSASSNVSFTMLPPPLPPSMLPLHFGRQHRDAVVNMIGFSKDRASQLDLLLRSIKEFVAGWRSQNIIILFCASTPDFAAGYQRTQAFHRDVVFVAEQSRDCSGLDSDFHKQLVDILSAKSALRFTMFMVDDMIFKNNFDPEGADMRALQDDSSVVALALRLHPLVSHGISGPRMEHVPAHFPDRPLLGNSDTPEKRKWSWTTMGHGDFAYPMSLNGHVFRNNDILPIIKSSFFHNPNLLEAALTRHARLLAANHGRTRMLAPRLGVVVNIPANVVQTTYLNDNMGVPALWFNNRFLAGARLTLHHLRGVVTTSGQSELPLLFYPSSVHVVDRALLQFNTSHGSVRHALASQCMHQGSSAARPPEEASASCTVHPSAHITAVFSWVSNDPVSLLFPTPQWCNKMVSLRDSSAECVEGDTFCARVIVPGCVHYGDDAGRIRTGLTVAVMVNGAAEHGRQSALRADVSIAWITKQPATAGWARPDSDELRQFDAVFTALPNLLRRLDSNASDAAGGSNRSTAVMYLPAAGTRIPQSQWLVHSKSKTVMFLVDYATAPWEQERNVLWDAISVLGSDADVDFIDSRAVPDEEHSHMFHILLGGYQDSGFSSDLLDCFLTGTVPIVRGSAEITSVFNAGGVILFESMHELLDIVQHTAHEELYVSMLPAINDNFLRAQMWIDPVRSILTWASLHNVANEPPSHPPQSPLHNHSSAARVDVNVVIVSSPGTPPSSLNELVGSVTGQQGVRLRVALVIDDVEGGTRTRAANCNDEQCQIFPRSSSSYQLSRASSSNLNQSIGDLVLSAFKFFGADVDLLPQPPGKTLGGSVVFVMDARDRLSSPTSLIDVALTLGCAHETNGSTCNHVNHAVQDSAATESTGKGNEEQRPWLTCLTPRASAEFAECAAIAFRSDLLRYVSKETVAPASGRDEHYRSLVARLFAALKKLSGDRVLITSSSTTPLTRGIVATASSTGVIFNTTAALHAADATPSTSLQSFQHETVSASKAYKRLVEFGARVHCAFRGSDGDCIEYRRPQIRILSPQRGNYFAKGGGSIKVHVLHFWIPEEGSLLLEIDGISVHNAAAVHDEDGVIEFHLSAMSPLATGPHTASAVLLHEGGAVAAKDSVRFGVI